MGFLLDPELPKDCGSVVMWGTLSGPDFADKYSSKPSLFRPEKFDDDREVREISPSIRLRLARSFTY